MSRDVKVNALGFYSGIFVHNLDIIYSVNEIFIGFVNSVDQEPVVLN